MPTVKPYSILDCATWLFAKLHDCVYYASMKKTLQFQIIAVANLSHFAEVTGLPRRTLNRIRAGYNVSTVTTLAVTAALKDYKPKVSK